VETSNNLASVAPAEDGASYSIVLTTRSSLGAALAAQRDAIARLGRLAGATVNQAAAYPGMDARAGMLSDDRRLP